METNTFEHSTPPKAKHLHEKFGFNCIKADLKLTHNFQTPPSRTVKIRNPFEPILQERLHTHFSSPSVCIKSETPKVFKWTIDDISTCQPAHIDEQIDQFTTPEHDSALESFAQSRIDTFFSMSEIVPSPFAPVPVQSPLLKDEHLIEKQNELVDNTTQTILTLPPKHLPEEVEEILRPYFSYMQNQQSDPLNSCFSRNLFCDGVESLSPQSSPAKSIDVYISPLKQSPCSEPVGRFFAHDEPKEVILKNCPLSPISENEVRGERSRLREEYSSHHMSIDASFNVQDINDLSENRSIDVSKVSVNTEAESDSTVQWDLEYKQISSPKSSDTSTSEMDVSASRCVSTPKSKIFASQRKKLSDSFRDDVELEDERNSDYSMDVLSQGSNQTDSGYRSRFTSSEESWVTSNFIASTPTKKKLFLTADVEQR